MRLLSLELRPDACKESDLLTGPSPYFGCFLVLGFGVHVLLSPHLGVLKHEPSPLPTLTAPLTVAPIFTKGRTDTAELGTVESAGTAERDAQLCPREQPQGSGVNQSWPRRISIAWR